MKIFAARWYFGNLGKNKKLLPQSKIWAINEGSNASDTWKYYSLQEI